MIIAGLDLETTGFSHDKGDRIVEVCFGIYQGTEAGITHLKTVTQRINPLRSIPIEAQRVHGISLEDLKLSPTWKDFAPKAKLILDKADMVVIHNAAFDEPFIRGEMMAAGMPITKPIPVFCTMANARWACADGKNPSLQELAWSLGIPYDPSVAHAADYDVGVMMECYRKGVMLGLYPNPIK